MIFTSFTELNPEPTFISCKKLFDIENLYLKIEGLNIAGSIKLKPAIFMVNDLEKRGAIHPSSSKLIESSSGNLGIALAIVCKIKNYPFICITDPAINKTTEKLIKAYGAQLIKVTERDEVGGYLGTRLKLIEKLLSKDESLFWTNQYSNETNIDAHYQTTAQEIYSTFDNLDYLFIGSGTTGTLMGCAKYFKKYSKNTKIIAVEPKGSVTFGGSASKRLIPGIGTSKKPSITDSKLVDEIIYVDETETVSMCHYFLQQKGAMIGGSTGSVLAAIQKKAPAISTKSVCVAIAPDFGERYIDTIYNKQWISNNLA